MLDLKDISVTFHANTVNERKALDHLSFHVENGDFISVLGTNGAGKKMCIRDRRKTTGISGIGWRRSFMESPIPSSLQLSLIHISTVTTAYRRYCGYPVQLSCAIQTKQHDK